MPSRRRLGGLSSSSRFGLGLLFVLLSGGTGQFFMAQEGEGLSLALGIGFYALSVFFLFKLSSPSKLETSAKSQTLSLPVEVLFFLLILSLGWFLRASGAGQYPEGVFADRAEVALGALRILHDHWRPSLDALSLHVPELCVYYMAAGWFKLFGESPEHFAYFDVFLSTAGIAFMYIAFRQLTGPFPSLLAFFLLAVMRWNFAFAHQVYFQTQTVFFMSLALAFLLYALRKQKPIWAALAGIFLGAGLYSYQAFKAVPFLILALMLLEFFREKERFRRNREVWAVLWVVFLLTAAPLLGWVLQNGELGRREPEVSILARIHSEKSLWPILENLRDIALVFNHAMLDGNSQSNFRHHRVLDDVTGVVFVLGFFYALRRVKEKPFYTALAGLGIMCLPGFFSISGSNLGRLLGATPFVAYLCGLFLSDLWNRWRDLRPSTSLNRAAAALGLLLLAAAGYENYYEFFQVQARLPECINDCSWPESRAGQLLAGLSPGTQSFLSSRFYGHPTVRYLAYRNEEETHPLDLTQPPKPEAYPKGSDFCFVLDEFKQGTIEFLTALYPGGSVSAERDALGNTPLYIYQVPAQALAKIPKGSPRMERGLLGLYRHGQDESEPPFLRRWDPILNFGYRDLPMTGTPLFIRWTGKFKAAVGGHYNLWGAIFSATDQGRIEVDQKRSQGLSANPAWEGDLKPGWHLLDFYFQDGGSPVAAASLLWKPPGREKYDFMPNEVLGLIPGSP
jgi:4-amino-4-deoxy-L-arabinose transferase-like glycosyltransferase